MENLGDQKKTTRQKMLFLVDFTSGGVFPIIILNLYQNTRTKNIEKMHKCINIIEGGTSNQNVWVGGYEFHLEKNERARAINKEIEIF